MFLMDNNLRLNCVLVDNKLYYYNVKIYINISVKKSLLKFRLDPSLYSYLPFFYRMVMIPED